MSNVRFDELELMLMAMFEQPTLRDTIQVLKMCIRDRVDLMNYSISS